jgi:hypothetical protein
MHVKPVYTTVLIAVLLWRTVAVAASPVADPTRPSRLTTQTSQQTSGAVAGGWILNSTLVSPYRRVAVINGAHVSEGESVDNATVVQIRKLDVDIRVSGKRITLPLLPDIVKRQP